MTQDSDTCTLINFAALDVNFQLDVSEETIRIIDLTEAKEQHCGSKDSCSDSSVCATWEPEAGGWLEAAVSLRIMYVLILSLLGSRSSLQKS